MASPYFPLFTLSRSGCISQGEPQHATWGKVDKVLSLCLQSSGGFNVPTIIACIAEQCLWQSHEFTALRLFVKQNMTNITCPVGIGLGCISKWLGWIPTVTEDMVDIVLEVTEDTVVTVMAMASNVFRNSTSEFHFAMP